ncbi:MAG: InlB B-repeat-containing protein, partial [Ruminococcaceae bacterium]|nr:InlB B-repeat-containing protein [Oscillospiraceae bacterium]
MPHADIPVRYNFDAQDSAIYVTQEANLKDLIVNTVNGPDGSLNAYVDILYTIKDSNDNVVGTYLIEAGETFAEGTFTGANVALTEDTTYKVSCAVTPIDASVIGAPAVATAGKYDGATVKNATVYVWAPAITEEDDTVDAGTKVNLKDYVEAVWTSTSGAPTPAGVAPALTFDVAKSDNIVIAGFADYEMLEDTDFFVINVKAGDVAVDSANVTFSNNGTATNKYTINVIYYSVAFDENIEGKTVNGMPEDYVNVIPNSTVAEPTPDPTVEGYTFGGWYTDKDCENAYDFSTAVTADITLYAKWTANAYEIRFNKNTDGATGIMDNLQMKFDEAKNLTANAFARAGYTFAGWAKSAAGVVEYANGALVENLTSVANDIVDLFAQWTVRTDTAYKVEFYKQANGAYSATADSFVTRTGTTDTTASVTDADKTAPAGYAFDSAAGNVLSGTIAGDGSLVLKVYFKEQFTVKYQPGDKGNFAEQSTGSLDYNAATPAFAGDTTDCAAGYHFTGWSPTVADKVTANATYVAQWAPNTDTKYTVEYYYAENGVYPSTANSSDVRQGTTLATVSVTDEDKVPTETGYAFHNGYSGNVLAGTIAGDGSLVLKVYFKEQFTVKYQPGDKGNFAEQSTGSLDYNATTPAFAGDTTDCAAGYHFTGWSPTVADKVTANATYV